MLSKWVHVHTMRRRFETFRWRQKGLVHYWLSATQTCESKKQYEIYLINLLTHVYENEKPYRIALSIKWKSVGFVWLTTNRTSVPVFSVVNYSEQWTTDFVSRQLTDCWPTFRQNANSPPTVELDDLPTTDRQITDSQLTDDWEWVLLLHMNM